MRSCAIGVAVSLAACAEAERVRIDKPWGPELIGAVMIEELGSVRNPQLLTDDAEVRFELPAGRSARLVAMAWRAPPFGPALEAACELDTTGAGAPLPAPARAWRSGLVGDGETLTVWSEAPAPYTLVARCPPRDLSCADVRVERVPMPTTLHPLLKVLALSATAAIAGGSHLAEDDTRALLLHVDVDGGVARLEADDVRTYVTGLAFDGREVLGATHRGDLFAIDPRRGARRFGHAGGRAHKLWARPGSATFVQRSSTSTPPIVELRDGGALLPRDDFPGSIREAAIAGPDTLFVATEPGDIFRGDDGWTREATRLPTPEFTAVAASGATAFVTQRYLDVVWRGPGAAWLDIGRPLPGFPNKIATLSRERAILVAEQGGIAVWDGVSWCVAESGTRVVLYDVSVASDGETAWVVGGLDGGTPIALRMSAP